MIGSFSSVTAKIFDMMGNAMGGEYFVADVVENILGLKYIFIVKSIFDTLNPPSPANYQRIFLQDKFSE